MSCHPSARSERAAQIIEMFALSATPDRPPQRGTSAPSPPDGLFRLIRRTRTLTLITGPSGSGKSSLLRALRRHIDRHKAVAFDVATVDLSDRPIVDCFDDLPLPDTLLLLARVGLGEAWSYIRTPSELSDGQRWRLRLAMALHHSSRSSEENLTRVQRLNVPPCEDSSRTILLADEFAALLDRVTARVVARAMRRVIAADANSSLSAVVATSHDDLSESLAPDLIVRCDFGRIEIGNSGSSTRAEGR